MWAAGVLLTAVGGAGFAAAAGDGHPPPPAVDEAPAVVERVREIFRAQDAALLERDASRLDGAFAPGCTCLHATRERVRGLRASRLLWTGYRSTITQARPRRLGAGAWTVDALLTGSATRVMTAAPEPERQLVRILPPERGRWVFHLRRATADGPLLLAAAEPRR